MSQKFSEPVDPRRWADPRLPDTLAGAWAAYSSRHFRGWPGKQVKAAEAVFMAGVATAYDLLIRKAAKSGGHEKAARSLLIEMTDRLVRDGVFIRTGAGELRRADGSKI